MKNFKKLSFKERLVSHLMSVRNLLCLFMGIVVLTFSSCQDLDGINNRIDQVELEINNLKSVVSTLQDAYSQGKIIKSVTPLTDANAGGWQVTFSDGTSIRLENGIDGIDGVNGSNGTNGTNGADGKDGITPFLKIDQDGYWTVSYDNGQTFTRLLDNDGNPIKAVGQDGKDGQDGEDGAEGLCIRLVINDAGYYVIQSYYQSDPTTVVNEIVTPYTADASRVIASMTQDDKTHVITMTLADGSIFTFNMHYVSPTSIAILSVNPVYLSLGTQASIEFRVNPSNALFNLSGDDCQIELDKVGTVQTRSSYVTTPSNYKLVRIEQVYDGNTEEMKVGQYRAIIEDTKKSAEYDEMAALVLNVEDANGDKVQISSSAFEVKGGFDEKLKTGLPIVILNTPNSDPIKSKVDWMAGATMTIVNPDMTIDYQGTLSIKGRGNSTWGYPKKPYALKLDKKEKILGMKKHKRWCLMANWMDRTMMRNAVAFEISRNTELAWTPSGKYVEVILNGRHIGNYYLCEQIKVDENRVSIAELDPKATEGDGVTGGYIFELDVYYDEVYKFRSATKNFPWMFKDPDEVNEAQFNWAMNYVNDMEDALYDATKFANREFADFMNLESYIDWWFVNELTMNGEIGHPKSCYMHKDANGKMTAGPVWDYDWGTFTPGGASSFRGKNGLYYPRLFADPDFVAMVKTRWAQFKPAFETNIPAFIDATKSQIEKSDELNAPMWPIGGSKPNGDESMNFDDAVARLKSAYLSKLNWLDTQIQNM